MSLTTGQIIRRRQVSMIPMTKHIIECVRKLAENEKMPDGIKIISKIGFMIMLSFQECIIHLTTVTKERKTKTQMLMIMMIMKSIHQKT
jgi:hypothetical protein